MTRQMPIGNAANILDNTIAALIDVYKAALNTNDVVVAYDVVDEGTLYINGVAAFAFNDWADLYGRLMEELHAVLDNTFLQRSISEYMKQHYNSPD